MVAKFHKNLGLLDLRFFRTLPWIQEFLIYPFYMLIPGWWYFPIGQLFTHSEWPTQQRLYCLNRRVSTGGCLQTGWPQLVDLVFGQSLTLMSWFEYLNLPGKVICVTESSLYRSQCLCTCFCRRSISEVPDPIGDLKRTQRPKVLHQDPWCHCHCLWFTVTRVFFDLWASLLTCYLTPSIISGSSTSSGSTTASSSVKGDKFLCYLYIFACVCYLVL